MLSITLSVAAPLLAVAALLPRTGAAVVVVLFLVVRVLVRVDTDPDTDVEDVAREEDSGATAADCLVLFLASNIAASVVVILEMVVAMGEEEEGEGEEELDRGGSATLFAADLGHFTAGDFTAARRFLGVLSGVEGPIAAIAPDGTLFCDSEDGPWLVSSLLYSSLLYSSLLPLLYSSSLSLSLSCPCRRSFRCPRDDDDDDDDDDGDDGGW